MKQCRTCQEVKPLSAFYTRSDNGRPHAYCKLCHSKRSKQDMDTRRRKRNAFLAEKRDACSKCGSMEMLHFHHVDPATKLFNLAHADKYRRDLLEAELAKCVVLCASCHKQHHLEED